ncbi:MAG: hypothetical protein AAGJ93_04540 [Bacteroidota bacterium]
MKNLFAITFFAISLFVVACSSPSANNEAFIISIANSYERAVENLEENTNLALSQSKSWLEDPSRYQFRPIHQFEEQVDADITELQYTIVNTQLSISKGTSPSQQKETYTSLQKALEELEQKLNTNYQQFLSEYQEDFLLDDDDFVNKIEYFSSQTQLLDEAWNASEFNWSVDQYQLILAKTHLDLATVKNWVINDLSGLYGGRGF